MALKFSLCVLFLIGWASKCMAQPQYFKYLGAPFSEMAQGTAARNDGTLLVISSGTANPPQNSLVCGGFSLLNAEGSLLNSRTFTLGQESFFFRKAVAYTNNNWLCLGAGGDFNQACKSIISVHSNDGTPLQTWRLRTTGADFPVDLEVLPNGHILVLCCSNYNVGYEEGTLIELDENFQLLRASRFFLPNKEMMFSGLSLGLQGSIFLGGYAKMTGFFNDAFVIKLNSNWDIEWQQYYGTFYDDELSDLSVDGLGNPVFCGYSYFQGSEWNAWWAGVRAENGSLRHTAHFDAGQDERFRSIVRDGARFRIAGDAGSFDDRDIVWGLFEPSGLALQTRKLDWGNPFTNYPSSIQASGDGGWVLSGDFTFFNGSRDIGLLKMDSQGDPGCLNSTWAPAPFAAEVEASTLFSNKLQASTQVQSATLSLNSTQYFMNTVCEVIPPKANWTTSPKPAECPGVCMLFESSSQYYDSLFWSFDGPFEQTGSDTVFEVCVPGPGKYPVRLVAKSSVGIDTLISLVDFTGDCAPVVPNAISPNGDGLNDTFEILFLPPGSRLSVYSRWGKRIYQSESYDNSWSIQESGVYYFVLEFPDNTSLSGYVSVFAD